jgi:YD repeat-containing protein
MSDREKAGLRGPVRSCIEETICPNSSEALTTSTEYGLDGKVLATCFGNPGGSAWVATHTYDAAGRLVLTTSGQAGEPGTETHYAYDAAGRSLSIRNVENGDRTDFHYDERGGKTSIQRFDPKTLQRTQNCAFGGSAWDAALAGFGVPAGGSVTTIYDENDRPVEARINDAADQVVSRVVRTYNAAGLIIEETPILDNPALRVLDRVPAEERAQLNPAQMQALTKGLRTLLGGLTQNGTIHTYESQNRVTNVRESSFVFPKISTIIYNNHGDKAEELTSFAANSTVPVGVSFSIDEDGTLTPSDPAAGVSTVPDLPRESDVRYQYQYDDYGNWTQLAAKDSFNPDGSSTVRRRKLTYY